MIRWTITLLLATTFAFDVLQAQPDSSAITNISLDSTGLLRWTIWSNSGHTEWQIEQLLWNKWVATNKPTQFTSFFWTTFTLKDSARVYFHPGANKFRIKITAPIKVFSKEVEFNSKTGLDEDWIWKVDKEIILDSKTGYEIFDQYGSIILKGTGKKINVSSLKKAIYYLVLNETTKEFIKK